MDVRVTIFGRCDMASHIFEWWNGFLFLLTIFLLLALKYVVLKLIGNCMKGLGFALYVLYRLSGCRLRKAHIQVGSRNVRFHSVLKKQNSVMKVPQKGRYPSCFIKTQSNQNLQKRVSPRPPGSEWSPLWRLTSISPKFSSDPWSYKSNFIGVISVILM